MAAGYIRVAPVCAGNIPQRQHLASHTACCASTIRQTLSFSWTCGFGCLLAPGLRVPVTFTEVISAKGKRLPAVYPVIGHGCQRQTLGSCLLHTTGTALAFRRPQPIPNDHCDSIVYVPATAVAAAAEPVLLDGLLQAVTLKTGDVVAVRTNARPMPTYFGCFEHQMQLNPKSIHRPVLATLMQVRRQQLLPSRETGLEVPGLFPGPHKPLAPLWIAQLFIWLSEPMTVTETETASPQ